jgi:hypothetical protein
MGCGPMADQTPLLVFFSCQACKAVFYATQKREPGAPMVGHSIQFYGLEWAASLTATAAS